MPDNVAQIYKYVEIDKDYNVPEDGSLTDMQCIAI